MANGPEDLDVMPPHPADGSAPARYLSARRFLFGAVAFLLLSLLALSALVLWSRIRESEMERIFREVPQQPTIEKAPQPDRNDVFPPDRE